jgi:hypothetical protein
MPVITNSISVRIRRIRAYLELEAGVVRDRRRRAKNPTVAEVGRKKSPINAKSTSSGRPSQQSMPIFFVLGVGKSGTTWLQRMLDQHPEILCKGEGWFFGREIRPERFKVPNAIGQRVQPASLYNALAEDEYLRLWLERTAWTRDEDVEKQLADLTREAVRLFLTKKLSTSGKSIVGDKSPLLSQGTVKEIGNIFPDAKVIHIIRDGRDRAVSWMHHIWNRERPIEEGGQLTAEDQDKRDRYREDPEGFLASGESIFTEDRILTASRVWASNVGSAHRDAPAVLGDNYTEVRYEDLLERPEQELERIFHFLGVGADKKVLRQSVSAESFEKRSGGRKRGEEDSTSARRKGVAGDWKNAFTERDKAVFKEIAGDLLVELGYAKDRSW